MNDILYASEANKLRDYVHYELTRRGITPNAIGTLAIDDKVTASWWNALKTNLNKTQSGASTATAGTTIITKAYRTAMINAADTLYNATVGKP